MANLNLITDPWIMAIRDGESCLIRLEQISDPLVSRLDWPRPDMHLACVELLVGLVYMACPPTNAKIWRKRFSDRPSPEMLQKIFKPYAHAFNLLGEGPRFMQDFDEEMGGKLNLVDMLFLDSAGENTIRKNQDVIVRRNRYRSLPLHYAAMALYTLQDFAPSGGRGNRVSLRGGGPMVTLVVPPEEGLWPLVWANVPEGQEIESSPDALREALPWMRRTDGGTEVFPSGDGTTVPVEAFFGQPRRLRLIEEDGKITGVKQKIHGNHYSGWKHPLTSYSWKSPQDDADEIGSRSPKHLKPGLFSYPNWKGILFQAENTERPASLERFLKEREEVDARLIVAGWAMSKMNARDFQWSECPVFKLEEEVQDAVIDLIEQGDRVARKLRKSIITALAPEKVAKKQRDVPKEAESAQEMFLLRTQPKIEYAISVLARGNGETLEDDQQWERIIRREAIRLFDGIVSVGLAERTEKQQQQAAKGRSTLLKELNSLNSQGQDNA